MTFGLIAIGLILMALAIGWLIDYSVRRLLRSRREGIEEQQFPLSRGEDAGPTGGQSDKAPPAENGDAATSLVEVRGENDVAVREAERRAAELVAGAEAQREALVAATRKSAGREAAAIRSDAKRTARAIVREAERRASEIVAAAEREQTQADEKRGELSRLVVSLLGQVERAAGSQVSNGGRLSETGETANSPPGATR